jgi:hypothetical protein
MVSPHVYRCYTATCRYNIRFTRTMNLLCIRRYGQATLNSICSSRTVYVAVVQPCTDSTQASTMADRDFCLCACCPVCTHHLPKSDHLWVSSLPLHSPASACLPRRLGYCSRRSIYLRHHQCGKLLNYVIELLDPCNELFTFPSLYPCLSPSSPMDLAAVH